jgi:hypothetical protein
MGQLVKKWVCQKNRAHMFDDTQSFYCTICPPYESPLIEEEIDLDDLNLKPTTTTTTTTPTEEEIELKEREVEVGLCVLLMDASDSMNERAFKGSPLNRRTLVANLAASGIFDLERMQNNPNAFIACFKFDDRVELMFVDTVANVIMRHKTVETFAAYINNELFKMQRGTDINKALEQAYSFVNKFLNKELEGFPVKNYTPMLQRIMKRKSVESVSIPNVRVLIYTVGMQYVVNGSKVLNPNPFKQRPIPGLNHDILIGAYFGMGTDQGCKDLQNLVSNCPVHNVPQFFLFDNPANIGNLKLLFRMASGASGFCPACLEKDLRK